MPRSGLEVAQILRRFGNRYRQQYRGFSPDQARVVSRLTSCRTAALGGHVEACDSCGYRRIAYNSCRDRHCPTCQGTATAHWLEHERAHLLPVPYSHVVFTLPHVLAPLALQNPRVLYGLLFRAAARTLLEIAADPTHLGALIGFIAILHTWGQTLVHHPHLHCLVPAGGLAPDQSHWVPCRRNFLLPVRVLGTLFRGKYLALLEESFRNRELTFHGELHSLADPAAFARLLREARRRRWVVYAKAPFGGPEPVLKYLARYTHRIAIANSRLLSISDDAITFTWKDYRHGKRTEPMRLPPCEFVRRFVLHVLPKGFVRIRRYGLLANAHRDGYLALCHTLLDAPAQPPTTSEQSPPQATPIETEAACAGTSCNGHCPACRRGRLRTIEWIPPSRTRESARSPPAPAIVS